jgi:hypothetical protein
MGRHERAANRAITAARRLDELGPTDLGAITGLRALARALDGAETEASPWAIATVARELRETLAALRLTPASRTHDGADPFAAWLATLDPDEHPAHPGPSE